MVSSIAVSQRHPWVDAPWHQKVLHWKEIRKADREFLSKVKQIFGQRAGIAERDAFERAWARAEPRFRWKAGEPLDGDAERRIETALRETFIYSGKGIEAKGSGPDPEVHAVVNYLLGKEGSLADWAKMKTSVLMRTDPLLLAAMQIELKAVLAEAAQMPAAMSQGEEEIYKAFVHNIIALLPYCYPDEGEEFVIPQKVEGVWKACKYRVDRKIELTPRWFSTPMICYGLTSDDGPPLLSFLGTTYPAGEGFVATVLSDFTPGLSVGHAPYMMGKEKIAEWFEGKQGVRLFGMSLGGAMTFQALRHHRDKIDSVDAFNPPGLYPWNWKERFDGPQKVNIYYQENDLVATMGSFPEGNGVSVFHVHSKEKEGMFQAHARVYTGGDEVTMLKGDPAFENRRTVRKVLTALHFLLSAILAFIPVMLAYFFYSIAVKPALFAAERLPKAIPLRNLLPSS
jgi:hypothetical protein